MRSIKRSKNRIRCAQTVDGGYKKLSMVLPLKAPLSLIVDPSSACNFMCSFCPTGDRSLLKSVGRKVGIMPFPTFKRIVDGSIGFKGKIEKLYLYKDGEPFVNEDFSKMVVYAKKMKIARSVETTSNGSLITKERAREVVDSGLDAIRISVEHVSDSGYKKFTKTFSDYKKIRNNVAFLYKLKCKRNSSLKIHAKILDINLTADEKKRFLSDFRSISDSVGVDTVIGWCLSGKKDFKMGLLPTTGMDGITPLKVGRKVCPQPFKTMSVNFDGTVSVCCVDWSFGTVIGDAKQESLVDIWNGDKMRGFRVLHLTNKKHTIPPCADCQYMDGMNHLSDIDDYAERLLEKLTWNQESQSLH